MYIFNCAQYQSQGLTWCLLTGPLSTIAGLPVGAPHSLPLCSPTALEASLSLGTCLSCVYFWRLPPPLSKHPPVATIPGGPHSVSVVPSGVALVSLLREWERKTLSRFMVFIFLLKYFKWKTSTLLRKTSHWVGECHNSILMKLIHIPHSLNSVHFKAFSWRLALAKALSLHLRFFL